jgi:aldehyde dehydrogenase (NAD+)
LPSGVFNLVMGRGSVVGAAMASSEHVAGVTFTGSTQTGRSIAAQCATRGAKVQVEMGGKNPLVVLDDADLGVALECAAQGAFYSTGQRCTASSRLIVTAGIHDRFVAALTQRIQALRVGHALESSTEIGPVVDESQLETDLEYLRIGESEGATLATGGERLQREHQGYYLSPALFVDTHGGMRINREEIFGPVASVIKVNHYEEALVVANDVPFGLSSGIVTTSLRYASDFKRRSQAGMVMVNAPTAGVDYHAPFGGRKNSSYGAREQGRYAAEFFTVTKTTYVSP